MGDGTATILCTKTVYVRPGRIHHEPTKCSVHHRRTELHRSPRQHSQAIDSNPNPYHSSSIAPSRKIIGMTQASVQPRASSPPPRWPRPTLKRSAPALSRIVQRRGADARAASSLRGSAEPCYDDADVSDEDRRLQPHRRDAALSCFTARLAPHSRELDPRMQMRVTNY